MTARVLHVSDLHIGRRDTLEPVAALKKLVSRLHPELVLATGDLAHRGRRDELARAHEILENLGAPYLAVPGNHDIPYTFPARFTRTFAEWERAFGPVERVFASDGLVVVGMSSVRPWRQQGGAVEDTELRRASSRLREAPPSALRVVALHHHLAAPPWRAARKRPLSRRGHVLTALGEASAELVVGGHVHQASIAEIREFQATGGGRAGSLVLATAPGLGRPRPHRSGEAQGLNVYEAESDVLTVVTLVWDGSSFAEIGRRAFPRR
ncbi:MAG: metallophosphoesterase family protein [Gaiellaceae bacterium]